MASAGVDPRSGKFQSTLKDVTTDQVADTIDATNRSQTDQQNKHVAGLQDVQAMGAGQKAEAMQGYQGIAAASQQKAISDAESSLAKQQATKRLISTVGSALVSKGLSSLPKNTPTPTSDSSSGVFGVSDTPFMSTNFRNTGGKKWDTHRIPLPTLRANNTPTGSSDTFQSYKA
ncbi:hypothetical protein [Pectobacterium jejuense]|uniref:Uncharacterized protein n=1 Tax=Pectobacterium jejuense TaxID=2974022 RepID=A0ABW8GSX6_9GAMM